MGLACMFLWAIPVHLHYLAYTYLGTPVLPSLHWLTCTTEERMYPAAGHSRWLDTGYCRFKQEE
jgi:hypothetical protein